MTNRVYRKELKKILNRENNVWVGISFFVSLFLSYVLSDLLVTGLIVIVFSVLYGCILGLMYAKKLLEESTVLEKEIMVWDDRGMWFWKSELIDRVSEN